MTRHQNMPTTAAPGESVALTRLFDDGGPIFFREERSEGFPWPAFVLHTSRCESSLCDCRDVGFLVRPIVSDGDEIAVDQTVTLEGLIHLDTERIEPNVEPAEAGRAVRARRPERAMPLRVGEEVQALLRRVRGQMTREDEDHGEG